MRIKEETMAEVVKEASAKMSDPNYSAVLVGGFVQSQAAVAQYISSYADELGGAEVVVNTIFHAALMGLGFQRTNNQTIREISFDELDKVAEGDREAQLKQLQPALLEFLEANVEDAAMKKVLMLIALAMEWVS